MKLYDCTVAVSVDDSGQPFMTVERQGVTENELRLLQHIHSPENVRSIRIAGEIDRDQRLDLMLLARKYSHSSEIMGSRGKALVERVFSTALVEYDQWLVEQVEAEEEERVSRLEARQKQSNQRSSRHPAAAQTSAEAVMKTRKVQERVAVEDSINVE